MEKKPNLELRDGRQTVTLVRPNGSPRPVLGTQSPLEDDRRARVAESLQVSSHQGRPAEKPATIEEALPVRSQTILSRGIPPEVRAVINGEITDAIPASRKEAGCVNVKIRLDP